MTTDLDAQFWRACDILRRDDNTQSLLDYVEQISWLLFLKSFEDLEDIRADKADYRGETYQRIIDGYYRWSVWTRGRVNQAYESLKLAQAEQRAAEKAVLALEAADTPDETKWTEARERLRAAPLAVTAAEKMLEAEKARQSAELEALRAKADDDDAAPTAEALAKGATDKPLLKFLDLYLFPHLRQLSGSPAHNIIRQIFEETPSKLVRNGAILRDAIDVIDQMDFHEQSTFHALSRLYEGLLAKMGREGGMSGEFYTPRPIIEFMVQMVDPKISETVYDPAAGSGGFLVEAYNYMNDHAELSADRSTLQADTFFGREKKPLPFLLGVMNCILHDISVPKLVRGNTLADDVRKFSEKQRFHVVLTNPPFGGTENIDAVKSNFRYPSGATSILFLQHIMAMTRRDGRVGMVIDEGVLFKNTERAYVDAKKELLEEFNLRAIISLPAGVFANAVANGTGPKTDLLFFDHLGPTRQVWYYEVHAVGFGLTRSQKPILENDLPECLARWRAYTTWQHTPEGQRSPEPPLNAQCWIVKAEDLIARNYELSARNPNRTNDFEHRLPEEIAADIADKQMRIAELIAEVQQLLEEDDEE